MPTELLTAGGVQDLHGRVEELKRELTEAHQREAAAAEVLRVIGSSPSDAQPVFEAIARSAVLLCQAKCGGVFSFDGTLSQFKAGYGFSDDALRHLQDEYPMSPRGVIRLAITGRAVVHVVDAFNDPRVANLELARKLGYRSHLVVPMLQAGKVVGTVHVYGTEPKPFSEGQISLLKTFADQAVIAIENTRLFEAEQTRSRELTERTGELTEALEYQTAISDVLTVISRSKFDLQPVLDSIVSIVSRLCAVDSVTILLREGSDLRSAAHQSNLPATPNARRPIGRDWVAGRTVVDQKPIHVSDLVAAGDEFPLGRELAVRLGHRTTLGIPLLRDDAAIGCFLLRRSVVQPFTQEQISLLQTFADQAVIAIGNTRLFDEVQARSKELAEALEQQTATSEVLGVISSSLGELEPVFQAMLDRGVRICEAKFGVLFRYDGSAFNRAAFVGLPSAYSEYLEKRGSFLPLSGSTLDRVLRTKAIVESADLAAEETLNPAARFGGARSYVAVPMRKDDELIGVIGIYRQEVRPFSNKQIALLEMFAEQAAIAIENARLFSEVQARNRDLTALGEVGRAVSSTLDLKAVLKTIVDRAVNLSGTDAGSIFYYREENGTFELGESAGLDEEVIARFRKLDISARESGLGEAIGKGQPLQIPDLNQRPSEPLRDAVVEAGFRASLIVPLLGSQGPLGTLILRRRQAGEFPQAIISLMQSFADHSVIALENARLFEEIAQKGRELGIASQHKSQFVANMSHELRTPLAAILGYAELMQEGFYEPLGKKSLDALARIRSNGKHLLGLINTVLDIAKIESGQFSLNLDKYTIESVVETVRAATESLAETKKLALKTEVSKKLPVGLGDEQRLTQVLLNLVGNAIKFTDTGEVRITAKTENSHFAVSVADTGPGIPADQLTRVFEQFHQIDNSNTKAKGGTGLGLAIARQIVEMHGGRIWVESTLGKGATFQMELPVRAEDRKGLA